MAIKSGWVERFHDDELIVPIPQLDAVLKALPNCLRIGETEKNLALGLARLSGLTGVEEAVRELKRDNRVREQIETYQSLRGEALPSAPDVSHLAQLIHGVKAKLALAYPGWQIVIGKNYAPSMVQSDPHTDSASHPAPHTDGAGHPDPHTDGAGHPDPHTDGTGSPTVSGSDCTGPIVKPDPHTDIVHKRTGDGELGWGVRVGVVDTKLFPLESLAGHYICRPEDLLSPAESVYTELDGHCTFVASCIVRQAPGAGLYVRHALDQDGTTSVWHAAVSIAELAPLGLDVVNLSFGEYMVDDDSAPMVLAAAIALFGPDTVVVASAGNNGHLGDSPDDDAPDGVTAATTSYPAALPGVVGVGAVNAKNEPADFTPHPAPWISLLALGVKVNAGYLDGQVQLGHEEKPTQFTGFANWSGCSFAAAVVSGIIAARTEPGDRSARQTLDELMTALGKNAWPGLKINP
jgi:Subtilase family